MPSRQRLKSNRNSQQSRQLLLAGGGHTHALVLRRWAMAGRPPGINVTLVNRSSTALYSGMVPGLIGGLYQHRECRIDLRRLAEAAGAIFIAAEIVGIDREQQRLVLHDRPCLRWDLLSLDVGAVTAPARSDEGIEDLAAALPIKPLESFLTWWETERDAEQPITVVGSGTAGLEVALAMAGRRRRNGSERAIELVVRPDRALQTMRQVLQKARITTAPAPSPQASLILCTGSRAPAWLADSGLRCDPASGRVITSNTLQVQDQPGIFASGDCALIDSDPRPPAGVWAVRAATPLARNLERIAAGRAPRPWHPPRRALLLLGDGGAVTGLPRAMAQWGSLRTPFHPLLWQLKQAIDRRFMHRFEGMAIGTMATTQSSESDDSMACLGCAAKLAAAPLALALAAALPPSPATEDAHTLLIAEDGSTWWQSVDGFPALVSDPWLNGRLTALHACSDLWASGASVHSALAVVSLPRQAETLQADLLTQLLAGIHSVLDPLGATLLGGHTLQAVGMGAETAHPVVQLTVNGTSPVGRAWPKGGLQAGDALILTRALGSGVLFAAAMAGAVEPEWIDSALIVMQQSQAPLVELLDSHGCHGCTDITGFGLLGHLGEMVGAANRDRDPNQRLLVQLDHEAVPALDGALTCLERGLASSLAQANRRSLHLLAASGPIKLKTSPDEARLELLVDPQTCGPLLAALPAAEAEPLLAALHQAGFQQASRIGIVKTAVKTEHALR